MDARTSLALWLRAGRTQRGMSLDDVARVTKIQPRILERLESGKVDGLPADVFVRGFVRSVARCVGLEESESLRRYALCSDVKHATPAGPAAHAVIDAMADLVPTAARNSSPRVLRDDPEAVDAGPLALATGSGADWNRQADDDGGFDEPAPNTDPLPELFVASAVSEPGVVASEPIPCEPVRDDLPDTQVMAPPADIDLMAGESGAFAAPLAGAAAASAALDATGAPPKKKRTRRATSTATTTTAVVAKGRGKRKSMAVGTPFEASPVVMAQTASSVAEPTPNAVEPTTETPAPVLDAIPVPAEVVSAEALAFAAAGEVMPVVQEIQVELAPEPVNPTEAPVEPASETAGTWLPKMPPPSAASSAPWRRPGYVAAPVASLVVVIDDADPDSAERELEDRRSTKEPRRSFLPPILMDREDRSARQGGLTLAVIILLIAATLTLSYLMRRPSSSGDGVTLNEVPTSSLVSHPLRG